jgi:hypothetical protein
MRHWLGPIIALGLLGGGLEGSPLPDDKEKLPDPVQFNRDIRPILSENCYKCHGPDPKARKGDLRLDTKEGACAEVEKGVFAIVPGKPGESELSKRVSSQDADLKMPPPKSGKKLSRRDIELLKKWIAEGAPYQGHWSFLPLKRPEPPSVRDAKWVRNPVDAFVLARLEKEGLAPSPEADRITLLRRLSFDVIGLPPTPEEVDRFLADGSAQAYQAQVERLLSSPHFGERMAIFWLDLVRFANSRGYHSDNPRMVDPYRDYVIAAFNENMKFDRFTLEQLAGDLFPEPTLRQRVASCYNKLNQTTEEGGAQAKEYEAKTAADRVRAASNVWLGATMGCSECHDHKFDPYTTRDFYSMAAFFADLKEQPIKDGDRGIPVPDEAQAAELSRQDAAIARAKERLETPTPELEKSQAEWEKIALAPFPWVILVPESVKSAGNASIYVEEDGSVLLSGPNPAKDTITLTAGTRLQGATAFRLEVLADPTLPGNGPGRAGNGNFVLSKFTVHQGKKAIPLHHARADHSQEQFPVGQAIDGKKDNGWAILPQAGRDHLATFETQEPAGVSGDPLTLALDFQSSHGQHVLGRFRLSATPEKDLSHLVPIPEAIRAILRTPQEKREPAQKKSLAAHYRSIAPALGPARAELAALEKKREEYLGSIPTCLVSASGSPRTMRIKPRGNWMDDSGEIVTPDTPKFLPPLGVAERRANRLDLARWMVSRENPLAARVFANRLWKLFFGLGLSKSLDDLGAQGEWPVHPELLDWLAADFRDGAWDVKESIRRIVLSSTYRQGSTVRPELKERDPFNRLLARQSRWRLDAELVRDNALAISGLLVSTVGGRSVRPYQPKGYWSFMNFPTREWQNDTGENAYRRGIYTWWQRTFPHPSLIAFDAPSREECCAERVRSNIPQQALVLLNDPTYVEASRVFAERILREGGPAAPERVRWAFRRALSRAPRPGEEKLLAELQGKHEKEFRADPKAAQEVVSAGQAPVAKDLDPAELASWTSVARALLNLHETITRN